MGLAPLRAIATSRPSSAKQIVYKHDAVADEAVIADRHKIADERVGLDFAARADARTLLNLDERANERAVPDGAAVEVDGANDNYVDAKRYVDNSRVAELGLTTRASQATPGRMFMEASRASRAGRGGTAAVKNVA